jgi:RHH-type proline utilization regulon transcriptional repressor/proline dehydrogenase/delta 1-pyrroline-5-carboxylate dehydrogenase
MTPYLDWDRLDGHKYRPEAEAVSALLAAAPLSAAERETVRTEAEGLVRAARQNARRHGVVESFLQQFSLSTPEGLALMCLAEALLRTPDDASRDALIAEAIGGGEWARHLGRSPSLFVNASTWGLMLTGKLVGVDPEAERDLAGWMRKLAGRIGEPVIRAAVAQAVRIMGEQFVLGRTIEAGLERSGREGLLCSFDMLGEGARTESDAARYEVAYAHAIAVIGAAASKGDLGGPERGHGISVKLSALSPRYEPLQAARVWSELYPRVLRLAMLARAADINFTLDAEEADRLVLSLQLLERLAREPGLCDWRGLGLAVQAYQKRAPMVIEALAELAKSSGRRLMVRLVKGAYWDTEIKRAQVEGRPGYPVYTTKPATDLSYLVCAEKLIGAAPHLYGQFATHNAHTLAAVRAMAARAGVAVEYQRLHGMGQELFGAAQTAEREAANDPLIVRTYAPVGAHEDLLPYLVRRLLENGANTSFVHRLLDEATPTSEVVVDPIGAVEAAGAGPHPKLPLPRDLYGDRLNSLGLDLSILAEREALVAGADAFQPGPEVGQPIVSPARPSRILGHVADADPADIDVAFARAAAAQPAWDAAGGAARAGVLEAMAAALEANRERLIALCVLEAGKTYRDAIGEVREAADFCRYYAMLAREQFGEPDLLKGPTGERNTLALRGRGVFVCISPWNFPLAIFTGQIAAALAAGNAVLAKPAEQTPLIARAAADLFHAAGLAPDLLILTPGDGATVGETLVRHPACAGVAFTGGSSTARRINRLLADRPGAIIPLIAETGGLNGMFVDTTAQSEQVIDDVLASAFGAAGQRCSALRLLFLPEPTADELTARLMEAMDTLVVGDPADPSTDIGPVIDRDAQAALQAHADKLKAAGRILKTLPTPRGEGTYFAPVLAEIPLAELPDQEVFGPVLHIVRYAPGELESTARALAAKGYGLTLGVHSRLEAFSRQVQVLVPAGNTYVNRSIIGAVVGVQPFGGEGLSGTGPKAGGPHALTRFAVERAVSVNIAAQGGDPELLSM